MGFIEILLLGVGLSMDAFAASVCKGLSARGNNNKNSVIAGIWFGGFQALMPLVGWFLGSRFESYVKSVDHWIAFGLLCLIGGSTLREALFSDEGDDANGDMSAKSMFTLAVATSIDALAVGITLALQEVNIVTAVSVIGITTFILSAIGVKLGCCFGSKYKKPAEIAGGIILILLGIKILLEHLTA